MVYGLKQSTTEGDVQALFPQANKIELHPMGGFAVLNYELLEDCKLDKSNASKAELKGRKLKISFKYEYEDKLVPVIKPNADTEKESSLLFVKNLGRSTTQEDVLACFKGSKLIAMPKKRNACRG